MRPSEYISRYGSYYDIDSLSALLDKYRAENQAEIEELKKIVNADDFEILRTINIYETEIHIAEECLREWKDKKLSDDLAQIKTGDQPENQSPS